VRAVNMTIGVPDTDEVRRMALHTDSPSIPGSIKSRITRAGFSLWTRASPSVPFPASHIEVSPCVVGHR
jgi:hypothetical protein